MKLHENTNILANKAAVDPQNTIENWELSGELDGWSCFQKMKLHLIAERKRHGLLTACAHPVTALVCLKDLVLRLQGPAGKFFVRTCDASLTVLPSLQPPFQLTRVLGFSATLFSCCGQQHIHIVLIQDNAMTIYNKM